MMIHDMVATRLLVVAPLTYGVRLARTRCEVRAAQALRYEVFNVELGEGLEGADRTGLDVDPFDRVCDHLLVEHLPTGMVVGTYRLQTGVQAGAHLGYYSAQEFECEVFEPWRDRMVELGRACVHREHRNLAVLGLLWKGIADYAMERDARFLFGCSSVNSQDAAVGASVYAELCRRHLVAMPWRTRPRVGWECGLERLAEVAPVVPKLLRAYLTLGARICGPPAMDGQFKTIDFLTWLDLESLPAAARERFLR